MAWLDLCPKGQGGGGHDDGDVVVEQEQEGASCDHCGGKLTHKHFLQSAPAAVQPSHCTMGNA